MKGTREKKERQKWTTKAEKIGEGYGVDYDFTYQQGTKKRGGRKMGFTTREDAEKWAQANTTDGEVYGYREVVLKKIDL